MTMTFCSAHASIVGGNLSLLLPGSGSGQISLLMTTSNINKSGEFSYRVDSPEQVLQPDTDECSEGLDTCASTATCTNTEGSYNCSCDTGYHGDGFTCNGAS